MSHSVMLSLLLNLLSSLRSAFRTQAELVLDNLALRQQLGTLRRSSPRPRLRLTDRAFWVGLSQIWSRWADALRGGYRTHPREMLDEIRDNGQLDWLPFHVVGEEDDITSSFSNCRLDSTLRPTDLA